MITCKPDLDPSRPPVGSQPDFENMIGGSAAMRAVFNSLRKAAASDAPVLLLGETGTGKELAAKAIHSRSARRTGPFVVINCSAIPAPLVESELFGHERGAFTGAHEQRKGRLECAAAGTLFLDEIGELPTFLQARLLRFLQDHVVERVGGRRPIRVDARVIAATHVNVQRALAEKLFREDLYYRLAVVVIRLPALRDRPMDIWPLAQEFLRRAASTTGSSCPTFTPAAWRSLEAHSWPGNVRELENRVRRAVLMADGPRLGPADLELDAASLGEPGPSLKSAREAVERELVERALRKHAGKIARAAAELQVSRPTFYELMDRLGISRGCGPERFCGPANGQLSDFGPSIAPELPNAVTEPPLGPAQG